MSPDGDRLAFLAARDEDTDLRVGRQDEADDDANESEGDEGSNGDDEPKTQVWCFDLSLGGDARQVTAFDEGVREFDWSPDGTEMVVSARDPTDAEQAYLDSRRDGGPFETERSQHKLDGVGYTDTVTSYLFVVDEEAVLGDDAAYALSALAARTVLRRRQTRRRGVSTGHLRGGHHNIGTPDRAIHRLEELTAWYRRHDPAIDDEGATYPHGRVVDGPEE